MKRTSVPDIGPSETPHSQRVHSDNLEAAQNNKILVQNNIDDRMRQKSPSGGEFSQYKDTSSNDFDDRRNRSPFAKNKLADFEAINEENTQGD